MQRSSSRSYTCNIISTPTSFVVRRKQTHNLFKPVTTWNCLLWHLDPRLSAWNNITSSCHLTRYDIHWWFTWPSVISNRRVGLKILVALAFNRWFDDVASNLQYQHIEEHVRCWYVFFTAVILAKFLTGLKNVRRRLCIFQRRLYSPHIIIMLRPTHCYERGRGHACDFWVLSSDIRWNHRLILRRFNRFKRGLPIHTKNFWIRIGEI